MEQNPEELLKRLDELTQDFSNLGQKFSKLRIELENSQASMLAQLGQNMTGASQKLEEFLDSLSQLAQEVKKMEGQKVRRNALEVLEQVLAISRKDGNNFPPLQECQEKARELHDAITNAEWPNLDSATESWAKKEEPFAALLELIGPKVDGEYSRYEDLRKIVAESFPEFGSELAMAALMDALVPGKLKSEDGSESEANNTETSVNESPEPDPNPISQKPFAQTESPEEVEATQTQEEIIEETSVLETDDETEIEETTEELIASESKPDDNLSLEAASDEMSKETEPIAVDRNNPSVEAEAAPKGTDLVYKSMEKDDTLLQGRYKLYLRVDTNEESDRSSESWLAEDEENSSYLINLLRYQEKEPNEVLRRIWDNQLRTLYRLSSSPGAEESILTLYDAGIDRDRGAFVMVLNSDCYGYETLATALANRQDTRWSKCDWLNHKKMKKKDIRLQIWQGLRKLAAGIELLHRQQVIHRNICAENIYFAENQGPDSWRLGGFEWSVRLGNPSQNSSPTLGWSIPPEFSEKEAIGYTFDTDWYAFGMLAARCFYNKLEDKNDLSPAKLYEQVYDRLETNYSKLSEVECALIQRLIPLRPEERLTFSTDVLREIDEIIDSLKDGSSVKKNKTLLILAFAPTNTSISDAAQDSGFVPEPDEDYNHSNSSHLSRLKNFLTEDFKNATLYPIPGKNTYVLVGHKITLLIDQYKESPGKPGTWDIAFAYSAGELRGSDGESLRELTNTSINVITITEARNTKSQSQSWSSFLPQIDEKKQQRKPLAKFREFLQCTNQLELLMRDAEIFAYRIRDDKDARKEEDGFEYICIEERERERSVAQFCQVKGGMLEFMQREWDSGRKYSQLFLLAEEDSLRLGKKEQNEAWEIVDINRSEGYAKLSRSNASSDLKLTIAPKEGYLRSWSQFAQIKAIERRKKAIDRLEDHSYLLQALANPRPIDTKSIYPSKRLEGADLDESKIAAIQDIQRVRPIYALQGPPGTGKTTLVAHLLREIIDEDPVAQILVTAQAHSAVDVLKDKVRNQAFGDVDDTKKPIAVRLGVGDDAEGNVEGTVEKVSKDILKETFKKLSELPSQSEVQREWGEILKRTFDAQSSAAEPALADFQELVKRGANITYCTTSAGDLEELAQSYQSFDWSIVEEAGKAHGFELALPLQAGHRWMLLGDHKQLPPYRYDDYLKCLDELDEAVNALSNLPRDRSLLDTNWLNNWENEKEFEDKKSFIQYAKDKLATFKYLFENLREGAFGERKMTTTQSEGAASGRLSRQYRMHPTIGDLIFQTFYDEDSSDDEDKNYNQPVIDDRGKPDPRVCHPFVAPGDIKDKAVVWINMPWCADNSKFEEVGENQGKPRYTSPYEAVAVKNFLHQLRKKEEISGSRKEELKVAVLSPYSQQVALLRDEKLRDLELPSGMIFKENLRARKKGNQASRAHTVDSFQGNEADVVIISLVRNNRRRSADNLPDGMGFLKDVERLNVLLSRAEKLLVLVGSWKFFEWHLEGVDINNRNDDLWEWKRILEMLNQAFDDKRAIKIPYNTIVMEDS